MTRALHTLMPGFSPLPVGVALLIGMRMSALRRLRQAVDTIEHQRFIAETCHQDPNVLTEAQLAQVNRLAWRYRWRLPPAIRPEADPGADGRIAA